MIERKDKKPFYIILFLFVLFIILNWAYVILVQSLPNTIINSWFVLFPFITVLYIVFSLIAVGALFLGNQVGFTFAYVAILFGTVSSALSYSLIYKSGLILATIFPYLLILNLCFVLYVAFYNRD